MDDYLSKPFAAEDIDRMVRKWIPPSAAPRKASPFLDHARLAALGEGPQGKEDTRRLLGLFLTTGRQSLERLARDQRNGDAPGLAKGMHRMKGSCATIGAIALAEKLKAMEAVLEQAGPEALAGEIEALGVLFDRTEEDLGRFPAADLGPVLGR